MENTVNAVVFMLRRKMTNKTLSDEMGEWPNGFQYLPVKDVKEFIKRLKENTDTPLGIDENGNFIFAVTHNVIDKLAGKELI